MAADEVAPAKCASSKIKLALGTLSVEETDGVLLKHAYTSDDVIELRISQGEPSATTSDKTTTVRVEQDEKSAAPPSVQCYTLGASTSLLALSAHTFHCNNLFDLGILLRRMTLSQRSAIRVFKMRWYTAECALWELHHPEHVAKTSSGAFGLLTGLEKIAVDCEGRETDVVREMKDELEAWIGVQSRIVVEMVGEKVKGRERWWWGKGNGGGWSFAKSKR
jgi:hypothetical protein